MNPWKGRAIRLFCRRDVVRALEGALLWYSGANMARICGEGNGPNRDPSRIFSGNSSP